MPMSFKDLFLILVVIIKKHITWLIATTDGKTTPRDFWQESEKVCPRDGAILDRHYTGAAQNVGIEQCPICHGFWFDGSELYAVAKASEPNLTLDSAIRGVAVGLEEELDDNYDRDSILVWDLVTRPLSAVPYIKDLLFNPMIAIIARE